MISEQDLAWQEAWKADIQRRARVEMPALLRSARTQRLEPLPTATIAPVTPVPASPDTGEMERVRETAMVPIVQLLPAEDTRALVSQAVRWFFSLHRCLPRSIGLNPLRCLAINQTYFPVDCEDLGCFTVEIEPVSELARDVVRCSAPWACWNPEKRVFTWGVMENVYL